MVISLESGVRLAGSSLTCNLCELVPDLSVLLILVCKLEILTPAFQGCCVNEWEAPRTFSAVVECRGAPRLSPVCAGCMMGLPLLLCPGGFGRRQAFPQEQLDRGINCLEKVLWEQAGTHRWGFPRGKSPVPLLFPFWVSWPCRVASHSTPSCDPGSRG